MLSLSVHHYVGSRDQTQVTRRTHQVLSSLGESSCETSFYCLNLVFPYSPTTRLQRAAGSSQGIGNADLFHDTDARGIKKAAHTSEHPSGMFSLLTLQHVVVIYKVKLKTHPSRLGRYLRFDLCPCKGEDLNSGPHSLHKSQVPQCVSNNPSMPIARWELDTGDVPEVHALASLDVQPQTRNSVSNKVDSKD